MTTQVSSPAWKWADSRMYSGPVLQAEIQLAAQIPSPALSTSGTGTKAHLSTTGGKDVVREDLIKKIWFV